MFTPDDFPRLLDAWERLLAVVQAEAQQNPAFAQRVQQVLDTAYIPAPTRTRAHRDVPDPFVLYGEEGAAALQDWLLTQDTIALRALIRTYRLDPGKRMAGQRAVRDMANFILERVEQRLAQGQVFLDPTDK